MATKIAAKTGNRVINVPTLHPGQQAVLENHRKTNVIAAGRRWRKTSFVTSMILRKCLHGNMPWMWCAQTADQARRAWNEMKKSVGHVASFHETHFTCTLPNGNEIYFRSLTDPDNLRGYTLGGFVVDEAGFLSDSMTYYKVLRPMILDTDGEAWLIGSPNGFGLFAEEYTKALVNEDGRSFGIQAPTLGARIEDSKLIREPHPYENPFIQWDAIVREYKTLPERAFRQEFLAEFIEDSGAVFQNVPAAVMPGVRKKPYVFRNAYSIGVDLGRSMDYTAVSVFDMTKGEQVFTWRMNLASWDRIFKKVRDICDEYHAQVIVVDSTGPGGDAHYDHMRQWGLPVRPFKFTNASKTFLVDHAAVMVEKRLIRLVDDPVQTNELRAFTYSKTDSGVTKMEAPKGMHDDTVTALILSLQPYKVAVNDKSMECPPIFIPKKSWYSTEDFMSSKKWDGVN